MKLGRKVLRAAGNQGFMGIRNVRCSQPDEDLEGASYPVFVFLMTAAGLGWGGEVVCKIILI